jgi:hypothetical protein
MLSVIISDGRERRSPSAVVFFVEQFKKVNITTTQIKKICLDIVSVNKIQDPV